MKILSILVISLYLYSSNQVRIKSELKLLQAQTPTNPGMGECEFNNGGCDPNANCMPMQIEGERYCMCKNGFNGNGLVCINSTCPPGPKPNGGCDPHARCV